LDCYSREFYITQINKSINWRIKNSKKVTEMMKKFDCNHKGFGKFCHKCNDIERGLLVAYNGKYYHPNEIKKMK